MTNEPLRVTLNDLLQSDTRGKWWLVGAGWQGNPLLEVKPVEKQEDSILEMAREQGMNTDVRRSIFVILMTSEVCQLHRTRYQLISRTLFMLAIG
jgi:nucleolar MIF4G domain-containing protein 1